MTSASDITPNDVQMLNRALGHLRPQFEDSAGHGAQLAVVLDKVLGAGGKFSIVNGERFEPTEHVFLNWAGLLWDIEGGRPAKDAVPQWCTWRNGAFLEPLLDPTGTQVVELKANERPIEPFKAEEFEHALRDVLGQLGFAALTEAVPPRRRMH